jgi:hypothetical protein
MDVSAEPGESRPRGCVLAFAGALALAALFAWNVTRTFSLGDDAFISFRYARHLADGLGAVWNPGERVEGYTNPAWVLVLAAGMRLGLAPESFANALGIASGVCVLALAFRFATQRRGRHERGLGSPLSWLLVALLAASGSFAAWCSGGLETMAFAALVLLGFERLFAYTERAARTPLGAALAFAGAALTRPEGLLFGALGGAWLALAVLTRRRSGRALLTFGAAFALPVAAHLAVRRAYYGEWLPNTFTAKVGGLWLEQGLRYFGYFHANYRIGWFLPLALVAPFGARRREAAAVLGVLLVYGGYVLAVGGDVFELRFWVHVFPLLYWLLVEGLAVLDERGGRAGRGLALAAAIALLATTALGFERVPPHAFGIQSVEGIREYTRARIDQGRTLRAHIEAGKLPRELVLCVGGAGAVPYYTGWTTVDRRGLNDRHIARLPVRARGVVGHEHDAPHEYLVERRVAVFDVFNQLLVKREGLRSLRGIHRHDGRVLRLRAVLLPLDERALVFATYVDDEELARLFAGLSVLALDE